MVTALDGRPTILNTFLQLQNIDTNATIQQNATEHSQAMQNATSPDDCIKTVFSEMDYIPWDNPENIVSAESEAIVRQLKNNMLVVLFLIGGPANVINMVVFHKQGLKDRVNLCLFALSLADELTLTNAVIHHGEQVYIQFTTREMFGPVSTVLTNLNLGFLLRFQYVSSVMSAIIATERCVCVFNPLKCQTLLSTKTMATIIIITYIVVMSAFFATNFRYRVGCMYDPVTDITIVTGVEGTFYKTHKEFIDPLETLLFGIGLPGVVMMTVVTSTIMTIVKLRQVVRWRSESSSSISVQTLALTKTLVANSVFFMICFFPSVVNRLIWLFSSEMNSGRRHHNAFMMGLWIAEIFSYINATFNFFVYFFMGSRFRDTFWTLFGRKQQPVK